MTTTAQNTEHLFGRPEWDCLNCGRPWPCASARTDLAMEFRQFPSVLAIYMTSQMDEALSDLTAHGQVAPPDLYERFLSWVGRGTPPL